MIKKIINHMKDLDGKSLGFVIGFCVCFAFIPPVLMCSDSIRTKLFYSGSFAEQQHVDEIDELKNNLYGLKRKLLKKCEFDCECKCDFGSEYKLTIDKVNRLSGELQSCYATIEDIDNQNEQYREKYGYVGI
jgi:hypothetical protein